MLRRSETLCRCFKELHTAKRDLDSALKDAINLRNQRRSTDDQSQTFASNADMEHIASALQTNLMAASDLGCIKKLLSRLLASMRDTKEENIGETLFASICGFIRDYKTELVETTARCKDLVFEPAPIQLAHKPDHEELLIFNTPRQHD
ncbi:hypothetical protein PAPHI01_2058 [Pancytospora philotis]|nr:hypothetical protein PAPHI01_2058 [Pancytospora philotis]